MGPFAREDTEKTTIGWEDQNCDLRYIQDSVVGATTHKIMDRHFCNIYIYYLLVLYIFYSSLLFRIKESGIWLNSDLMVLFDFLSFATETLICYRKEAELPNDPKVVTQNILKKNISNSCWIVGFMPV